EKVSELFDKMVTDLQNKKRFKNLTIETKLLSGHPVVNILDEAKQDEAGLIVMGTKGTTKSRKLLFGSFTTETILHANIPVLAIPEGRSFNKFKQIVFTTDFYEDDLAKVEQMVEFAKLFNSTLRIVHVAESENLDTRIKFRGFKEIVKDQFPEAKLQFDLVFELDFFTGIADYLEEKPADLLVMVRYKKTFWESLVSRSFSKEMGFYTEVPLLVLMADSRENPKTGKAAFAAKEKS
ncbi:MAG: universal stress protein, partial [Balneolaceae bacterium]|nr:universal stress protein [Balneolaceae bacterium]